MWLMASLMSPPNEQAASPGRRERNKAGKLRRIQQAVRSQLSKKSYELMTTREIARLAGVALGTLFLYADDKRDLLFLTANDDLEVALRRAEAACRPDCCLLDNLVAIFAIFYRYFGRQPGVSRAILREMNFYEAGQQAGRFLELRDRLIALVGRAVNHAMARREIVASIDPAFAGWVLFSIYQAEVRRWLWMDKAPMRQGLASLRRALELVVHGLKPNLVATPRIAP